MDPRLRACAEKIDCLILDVDGVLTTGQIYFTEEGEAIKAFHTLDGQGLKMLLDHGIEVAIITGRQSKILSNRLHELGIKHFVQGRLDKAQAYKELSAKLNLVPERTAYIGDDLPDLSLIVQVGLGVCVPNAHDFVKDQAPFMTTRPGGLGAAREVCDWILESKGLLQATYDKILHTPIV